MKPVALTEFVDFLRQQSAADFRGKAVDDYLSRYRVDEDGLAPFIFFREDTYGRNLVLKTELFELLVLTWLPRHRTPIHDHAGQRCWMLLSSGTLVFRNYASLKEDEGALVAVGPLESHSAGDAVYIDDGIGIHSISNVSDKPAVSLHLYAGPIPRCRIYNETKRQLEWRELEYFTRFDGEWEQIAAEYL